MFYDTKLNNHGLKSNPFKACIVPRPIGWISTINEAGIINVAPYSYFNAVADIPPTIMFASGFNPDGSDKDSLKNIEVTREFVVNIASFDSREMMNCSSSSLPHGVSEAEAFSIETSPSHFVKPPRIKAAHISFECKYLKTVEIPASSKIILGTVVGIYIDDEIITEDRVDIQKLKPIARLGYNEYAVIEQVFKMNRP